MEVSSGDVLINNVYPIYNYVTNLMAQYLVAFFLFRLEIIRAINNVRHDFVCIVYTFSKNCNMHFPKLDDRLFLSDDFPTEILVESRIMRQTNGS